MRKALFILMLAVAGVFVGVLMSPARKPVWQPKTQIVFLGFTNTLPNAPATNAWFGIKNLPQESVNWTVADTSDKEGGKWRQCEALSGRWVKWSYPVPNGFHLAFIAPVRTTNAPARMVFELEQAKITSGRPPTGKVTQLFEASGRRWRRFLYPDNPVRWSSKGPLFYITNEFNFAAGTNAAAQR